MYKHEYNTAPVYLSELFPRSINSTKDCNLCTSLTKQRIKTDLLLDYGAGQSLKFETAKKIKLEQVPFRNRIKCSSHVSFYIATFFTFLNANELDFRIRIFHNTACS